MKKLIIIEIFIFIFPFNSANLCPDSTSCNCIITDDTNLEITCTSVLSSFELPTLNNATLQAEVTSLTVRRLAPATSGPLTALPTNLCSAYPNINTLDLSSNSITGLLNTSELACLGSNLRSILLSDNLISEIDLNFFQSNRQLQTIDLSANELESMPLIDSTYFFDFISTLTVMNLSYNQITHVDFWPIFVRTSRMMTIDMSHNQIRNYTNIIPIVMKQLTRTPDPRIFYLNDNRLERFSDVLLQQYGACTSLSNTSVPYFIVGISNVLLTNNPLICDCESNYLVNFLKNQIYDYPMVNNRSALLIQAQCSSPVSVAGQSFIFSNYTTFNICRNYVLPSMANAYCSVYSNVVISTIAPPVFTSATTAASSTTIDGSLTTNFDDEQYNNSAANRSSSSPEWYIILGIVLGLLFMIMLITYGCCLCNQRYLPEKCRSRFFKNNLNTSYEPFIRPSEDDGANLNAYHTWDGKIHPANETQTCFQIVRSKPTVGPPKIKRAPQKLRNLPNENNQPRKRKTSSSSNDGNPNPLPNGTHVVKGIPLTSLSNKTSTASSNGSEAPGDTSAFELSMTSVPLTPSKRAKLLPPLKGGTHIDSSGGAMVNHRQRRRLSATWSHRQNQSFLTSTPFRPPSLNTPKNAFHDDESTDDEKSSIPTVEGLTNKSSKPLRALPLLNITVVPARIDNHPN